MVVDKVLYDTRWTNISQSFIVENDCHLVSKIGTMGTGRFTNWKDKIIFLSEHNLYAKGNNGYFTAKIIFKVSLSTRLIYSECFTDASQ